MGYDGERLSAVLILSALAFYMYVVIIIPFSGNNLQTGDMPGHVAAAQYIRDHLWPSPIGWDPSYFAGYPLNQFYSPLLSWTVATLGFVMPIDFAFKLLLMIAARISYSTARRSLSFRRILNVPSRRSM